MVGRVRDPRLVGASIIKEPDFAPCSVALKSPAGCVCACAREALHSIMGFVPGSCHLLIATAHVRQAYDDGEPVPQVKEAKFYDRVWQTLDLVAYLVRADGQAAPKALFAPPYGKARLPAMPEELASFRWEEVFKYAVTELELPSPEERRQRIEEFLARFKDMVGESP